MKKLALFTGLALFMLLCAIASGDWAGQIFWGLALVLDGSALWHRFKQEDAGEAADSGFGDSKG